jgi:hypothetical protein
MAKNEKKRFIKHFAKSLGLTLLISFAVLIFLDYWDDKPLIKSMITTGIIVIALYPVLIWAASRLWDYKFSDSSDSGDRPAFSEISGSNNRHHQSLD